MSSLIAMASWSLAPLSYLLLVWFPGVTGELHSAVTSLQAARSSIALQKLIHEFSIDKRYPIVDFLARGGFDATDKITGETLSLLCENHTNLYGPALRNGEVWAMKMFDASTKIPEGLLVGTFTHLGNFDECINVRDVQTDSGVFHGQHCLASLGVDLSTQVLDSRRLQEAVERARSSLSELAAAKINVAVCVPSSCSASDTALLMQQALEYLHNFPNFTMRFTVEVSELACHTTDRPEFKSQDWAAVGIMAFFAVLVVLSTAYDILQRNAESRSNLLLAFSVYSNGKKLLATSSTGDTLHAVHGIRFLSIAWIILAHRYMDGYTIPSINMLDVMSNFFKDWTRLGITNGVLAVDSFFVLSGLLVSYVFFKQVPRMKSFNIPMYYIHRYIRLTPAFAVIILLQATLLNYAGSGPLWDTINSPVRQNCHDNWWPALLYVHNYIGSKNLCVSQSWYLAVDMQLHWLSPLVLIPLWKWPRIGTGLLGLVSVGGLITNFVISYVNEFIVSFSGDITKGDDLQKTLDQQQLFYYPTYTRFTPYVIGIGLGYFLVDLKTKGRKIQLCKVVTLLLWLSAAAMLLLSLCIVQIFQKADYEYEPVGPAFYNALGRPVWALGLSIVIFLCSTGHGGYPNTLLSWALWQPLSRLSYSLYLVHIAVQTAQKAAVRTPAYLDDINTIPQFCGDLLISIFFVAILSLVFESPFIILEKELLGGRKRPQRTDAVPEKAVPLQDPEGKVHEKIEL